MVSCTVCRKAKGRAKVEVSTASATTVESQVIRPSSVMQKVEKRKERERTETAKVGMTVKVGQSERDGQKRLRVCRVGQLLASPVYVEFVQRAENAHQIVVVTDSGERRLVLTNCQAIDS